MPNQFQFSFPTKEQLDTLIESQRNTELTYNKYNLQNYDHDKNQILLGSGKEVWEAAKRAIKQWAMFPDGWAQIYYQNPIFKKGDIVVMNARVFGVWWLNTARILTVVDDDRHFGFAYGTLPNHVETGEELFQVLMDEQGDVYYSITAFSRPRFWAVRFTYPLSRVFQKKFVKDSLQKMKKITNEQLKTNALSHI
jgi:uncharacterized protein (UPF0548 family)